MNQEQLAALINAGGMAPVELLRMFLDAVEAGVVAPTALMLLWNTPTAGGWQLGSARAGLPPAQAAVYLELARQRFLREA